jgi:hypothetical protein
LTCTRGGAGTRRGRIRPAPRTGLRRDVSTARRTSRRGNSWRRSPSLATRRRAARPRASCVSRASRPRPTTTAVTTVAGGAAAPPRPERERRPAECARPADGQPRELRRCPSAAVDELEPIGGVALGADPQRPRGCTGGVAPSRLPCRGADPGNGGAAGRAPESAVVVEQAETGEDFAGVRAWARGGLRGAAREARPHRRSAVRSLPAARSTSSAPPARSRRRACCSAERSGSSTSRRCDSGVEETAPQ